MQNVFDRNDSRMIMKLAHRIASYNHGHNSTDYVTALQQGLKYAHECFNMSVKASAIANDWRETAAVGEFGAFKMRFASLSENYRIASYWWQFGENRVVFRIETKIGNEWYGDQLYSVVNLDARNIERDLKDCAHRFSFDYLFTHFANRDHIFLA